MKKRGYDKVASFLILVFFSIILLLSVNMDHLITGKVIRANCLPEWKCSWSQCVNNMQRLVCYDVSNCDRDSVVMNRPCTRTENCTDSDGDGFGIGSGCFGRDPNDQDPSIVGRIENIEAADEDILNPSTLEGGTGKYILIVLIALVLFLIAYIIIVSFIRSIGKRKVIRRDISQLRILKQEGRRIVEEARADGYTDKEIFRLFKRNGWENKQIKEVLR